MLLACSSRSGVACLCSSTAAPKRRRIMGGDRRNALHGLPAQPEVPVAAAAASAGGGIDASPEEPAIPPPPSSSSSSSPFGWELDDDFSGLACDQGLMTIAGFGSLLSETSARSTFPHLKGFRQGRLRGWRRVFTHQVWRGSCLGGRRSCPASLPVPRPSASARRPTRLRPTNLRGWHPALRAVRGVLCARHCAARDARGVQPERGGAPGRRDCGVSV